MQTEESIEKRLVRSVAWLAAIAFVGWVALSVF